MIKKTKTKIRDFLYDYFLGTGTGGHTDSLYNKILDLIPDNSKILDVGCGNGTSIINNIDKIKKKNLKIDGIDIDEDYINSANEKCRNNNAENFVTFTKFKISLIDESMKWDYVIFSEVYPVVDKNVMTKLILKAKKILKPDGRILMIHNICEHPTAAAKWLKPKLKYFISADFGKYTSMKEFEDHMTECELEIENKKILFVLLAKNFPKKLHKYLFSKQVAALFGVSDDQGWRNNAQWYFKLRNAVDKQKKR